MNAMLSRTLRLGCLSATLIAGGLVFSVSRMAAQENPQADAREYLADYESSAAYPFGRPNPSAPAELRQFDYMVGAFDCMDRALQRDGSWKGIKTTWKAYYFMNGHAVQDIHWKQGYATTNLRFYDAATGKWQVTWFKIPPYGFSSGSQGAQEGENMVMRREEEGPDGKKVVDVLTFFNIQPDSYEWKAERFVDATMPFGGPYWRISCQRRR